MHPLSLDVWIYIVVAYFIVSFLLFILARWPPALLDVSLREDINEKKRFPPPPPDPNSGNLVFFSDVKFKI